jgi:hypothetical protein
MGSIIYTLVSTNLVSNWNLIQKKQELVILKSEFGLEMGLGPLAWPSPPGWV